MASLITLTADFAGWFDIFRVILYYLCCMMFSSLFLSDYLIYIWSKFQSLADLYNLFFFFLISLAKSWDNATLILLIHDAISKRDKV
jgi:hypothetical protein